MQHSIARTTRLYEDFDKHALAPALQNYTSSVVLLAEDDADDRDLAIRELKKFRKVRDIYCVKNGMELMDYLETRGAFERNVMSLHSTVILLDLNMPRMNGREVLRRIREDSFLASIPVVVLSGDKSPEAVREAYELGADAFLSKPFDLHRIWRIIEENL